MIGRLRYEIWRKGDMERRRYDTLEAAPLGVSFNSRRVITKSKPEYSTSLLGFEPILFKINTEHRYFPNLFISIELT